MIHAVYLPPPSQKGNVSVEEAIARRRSIRQFTAEPISLIQLSQLLWAAQGLTGTAGRAVPSAGATYPLEVFVVCGANGIEAVRAGIYRYHADDCSLALHHAGDVRSDLARASLNQEYIYRAPVDIVICALYRRTAAVYGSRGERYVHIEVGHAGQNIYLQATALGLGTVATGAFDDEQVREVLRLDKQVTPLYIMPVGKPA